MTRRVDLETADTTHVRAIAVYEAIPDKAKKPDQWRRLAINQRSLIHIREELAKLGPDTAPPAEPPPVVEPPVISGDALARAKAWDHVQARDEILAITDRDRDDRMTPDEAIAALGEGQFGRAVDLGLWGFPYWGPQPSTQLTAEQFALGDADGGLWMVENVTDFGNPKGNYGVRVWHASQLVFEDWGGTPFDSQAVGKAHGISDNGNSPA